MTYDEFDIAARLMAVGIDQPLNAAFDRAIKKKGIRQCARALGNFANNCGPVLMGQARPQRSAPPSETLPPLP